MQGSRGSKKGTSVFHGMEPPQGCTLLIWDTIISYVSDKSIDLIRYIDQSDERDRKFVHVHHMKETIRIGKAKKLSSPLWLRHKKKIVKKNRDLTHGLECGPKIPDIGLSFIDL